MANTAFGNGFAQSEVNCSTGDIALSGSYDLVNNGGDPIALFHIFDVAEASTQGGWITGIDVDPAVNQVTIQTFVRCFDNSP